ncbi:MAG: hypothetical protein ACRENN_10855 [Candidatus Eiseniibacteriota bacterium]
MNRSSLAVPVVPPSEGAGARPGPSAGLNYLRRYAVQAPRRRHGALLVWGLLLAALLFSKVWEGTVANSLSMERDRLRRDVSALQNRIRLSSDLRDQAALKEGIDSETLRAQGFLAPDPSRIIEIDLRQAMPRALSHSGVVARVETWIRGFQRPPRVPDAPGAPGAPSDEDARAVPVRASVGR